jgi:hypothetical protein
MYELRRFRHQPFHHQPASSAVAEISVSRLLASVGLVIAFVASCPAAIRADDRMEAAQIAVNHMAEETLECAAYFDVVSLALMNSNDADTAEDYIKARKLAVDRAESLNQGILSARYDALIRDMSKLVVIANPGKQIDEKLSNISIEDVSVLRDRYAMSCKEIIETPGSRAKYWMEHKSEPAR